MSETISLEAFNAVSLERDRYRQQALWLKTYAEELQADLMERHDLIERLKGDVAEARDALAEAGDALNEALVAFRQTVLS